MMTWRVRIEVAPPGGTPPGQRTQKRISDQLRDHDPQVVVEYDGHLSVAVSITASSRRVALDRGDKAIVAALAAIGIEHAEVVEVGVLTGAEYERRQHQPRCPRLAGVSEAADILEVTTARVKRITVDHADRLPMVTQFKGEKGAKVWLDETWRNFNKTWDRKRTGRPVGSGHKPSKSTG